MWEARAEERAVGEVELGEVHPDHPTRSGGARSGSSSIAYGLAPTSERAVGEEPPMRVFNFSAGPAVLPREVLERAAAEMLDWHGSGMSVMEMSHRERSSSRSPRRPRPTCAR